MRFDVVTIFPEAFRSPLEVGLMGKAVESGLVDVRVHDLRDWAPGPHRKIDDEPFGGGAGMVMAPGPIVEAVESILAKDRVTGRAGHRTEEGGAGRDTGAMDRTFGAMGHVTDETGSAPGETGHLTDKTGHEVLEAGRPIREDDPAPEREASGNAARVVLLTAAGRPLDDQLVRSLAGVPQVVLVCGRYEGIDDRVAAVLGAEEVSIGDFVLLGGEVAAMAVIEAVSRHVPGVLGNASSLEEESFGSSLLEYPQFTRPAEFRGIEVPPVLVSGDHGKVARWRREQALRRTAERRPDLLESADLTPRERRLVEEWRSPGPAG